MGLDRNSYIYGTRQDFDLGQLWAELSASSFGLANPDTGRICRLDDEDGSVIPASPEEMVQHFRAQRRLSFNLWHMPRDGADLYCGCREIAPDIVEEDYEISPLRHTEETRHLAITALLNRAIRKARRSALYLFTLDFSGGCEEQDFRPVAQGNLAALQVVPEIIGLPELSARKIQPFLEKQGFRQFQVGSIRFCHAEPLPAGVEVD